MHCEADTTDMDPEKLNVMLDIARMATNILSPIGLRFKLMPITKDAKSIEETRWSKRGKNGNLSAASR